MVELHVNCLNGMFRLVKRLRLILRKLKEEDI